MLVDRVSCAVLLADTVSCMVLLADTVSCAVLLADTVSCAVLLADAELLCYMCRLSSYVPETSQRMTSWLNRPSRNSNCDTLGSCIL